jgi:hypothetical protein
MIIVKCVFMCVAYMCVCVCVCLCLCSNLFSYVLQCVQWILYTLPHRCSLLHHSIMFLFEYDASVHCVKAYRSRAQVITRQGAFFN